MKRTVTLASAAILLVFTGSAFSAGDAERGKTFYAVCAACHGPDGEGMQELNAPALAGQEEWYIVRQLQNFKTGIRGKNPGDIYGMQMAPMAMTLPDDQAMEDVAAYLSSLGD